MAPQATGTVAVLIPTRGDRMPLLTRLVSDLDGLRRDHPWIVDVLVGCDPGNRAEAPAAGPVQGARWFVARSSGAANVRNELAARSTAEFLAFLDDDVAIGETWIGALACAAQDSAAVWAGAIEGASTSRGPGRIREQIGEKDFGPRVRPLSPYEHAGGANLVVRRDFFDELGGFRRIFGGRNEDVDLHRRASMETNVMWNPALQVTHLLPQSDAAFDWRAQGQSDGFVDGDLRGSTRLRRTLVGLLRWAVSGTPLTYSVGYIQGTLVHRGGYEGGE